MQITYQKRDGCVMQRQRSTMLPYKIGEITSMGWKVLNIEYEYKNKYYSEYEYNRLIYKNKQRCAQSKLARELYVKEIKNFLYCTIAVLIISYLKRWLGI